MTCFEEALKVGENNFFQETQTESSVTCHLPFNYDSSTSIFSILNMPFDVLLNTVFVLQYEDYNTILLFVYTNTRNDLKPAETIWNYLKPPRNYLRPPETSHIMVFLLRISYSQVGFVLMLHPTAFFGPKMKYILQTLS